ncbi:PLD phosphodiesterase domain-containing protein [Vibrio chagasii]|nr:Putative phosphodiesterase [Vibrio chagasii]CAH6893920.1 PLD phosphodiesterase domain-containing protein [Vibrio chagasii]CAH6968266.1 PLD phosphodiesterase domain-containing protein [Vibrio chagasii]CAH7122074.1 PLD phosphodiesterase domain-containing protein [Vibrio chagasii]CAH7152538.1 PLD phosphodiesterase domain-containing protein [Vibrio chagasii]
MKLLVGDALRNQLVDRFSTAKNVTILSAYFTLPAAKLLLDYLPLTSQGRVVVRARPQDLLSGATDIKAIRYLFDNGIPCHIHRSLHAKLYVIDNKDGWIGSANFTSNGLKISGYGNVELSTQITISEKELKLVRTIISDSLFISKDILENLEYFVEENVSTLSSCDDEWWEDILDVSNYDLSEGLLITDLPWCNPNSNDNSIEALQHDKDVFKLRNPDKVCSCFKRSKVYKFLYQKLQEEVNSEVYFGTVTEWIHSALKDDMLPYRSEIKDYIFNLYSYIDLYGKIDFIVDRPNYSQRIRLINHE